MAKGKGQAEGEPPRRKRGTGSKTRLPSGSWQIEHPALERRETYPDEQAADARLEEVNRLVAQKINVARGQQTVTDWFTEFLSQRARDAGRAERSKDADKRNVEGYIVPVIGHEPLDKVDGSTLQSLINGVQDGVRERRGEAHDGTRTAQLVASLLNQAFEQARKLRYIPFNPMDGVEIPSYERASVIPPDETQLASVLLAAADSNVPYLWYGYALLGVRRGEALGWTWEDFDAEAGTLRVRQQVQAIGGALQVVPPKSQASIRTLPLPDAYTRLLRSHQKAQAAARLRYGPGYDRRGFIVAGPDGRPWWPSSVNQEWYKLRTKAGLPATVKLHHLRHALSTLVDESEGITESKKNDIFGHEAKTIGQHYTRSRIAAMRRVLEQAWERVWRAMEKDEGEATG